MTFRHFGITFIFSLALLANTVFGQYSSREIDVEWKEGRFSGSVVVTHGNIAKIELVKGRGKIQGANFTIATADSPRLRIRIDSVRDQPGPGATMISLRTSTHPFTFFVRDIQSESPIYIPDYQVVVLPGHHPQNYSDVELAVLKKKLKTKIERIETEPEVSFESIADKVKRMTVPTWLGVSRDFRIFEISESLTDATRGEASHIAPKFSSTSLKLPQLKNETANYIYTIGRGVGVQENAHRHLEDGSLPILHSVLKDDDIEYHSTTFVALEKSPLAALKGTDFLVADSYSGGHMFTKEQEADLKIRKPAAMSTDEETVLFFRTEIRNTGQVPRYAWIKTPRPGTGWWHKYDYRFDAASGMSSFKDGTVFCISKLNGKPLPNEEMAVLVAPGASVLFEFTFPHSPISPARAQELALASWDNKLGETKQFWQAKLEKAGKITVPEKRISEMLRAGLLHLDLITYGNEPDATLAPNIGVYSPIGTESAPIVQFYTSMGRYDLAKRSINYFLDKQHDDGFIQNFGGYMVETGAALWTMGEYFRHSRDLEWAKIASAKILKSCNYLIDWRNKNKKPALKGRGYGMIDGKVADPEDHFHQFMLNGYAYLGLIRAVEILESTDPGQASRIRQEAKEWKADIRESFFHTMALSPVVPLGDGTWCPTAPPWADSIGLRALYLKNETFWSHGTFGVSDAMLGPMYLVFCEVLDVNEPVSRQLLDYHSELFFQENAAFSQPYYSRHNWVQARLGMTKPFLSTYYNTFAALADRETYTFWEHLYRVSAHKTHEEAWFLMETRWMLYMEEGKTLKLFSNIPRNWMEDGKQIKLDKVSSYFGLMDVHAQVNQGRVDVSINCADNRKPERVVIRLPHPDGEFPKKVTGGKYVRETESVVIDAFTGMAKIQLEY
jgi:hypothetical protein